VRNFGLRASASASTNGSPYWSAYFAVAKKLGVPMRRYRFAQHRKRAARAWRIDKLSVELLIRG
jgi:hypothetical protein